MCPEFVVDASVIPFAEEIEVVIGEEGRRLFLLLHRPVSAFGAIAGPEVGIRSDSARRREGASQV